MPCYCLKVIFYNSKVNLGIKTTEGFCCNISIFQFKKELLLIYGCGCKTYCFHASFKPFCTLVCPSQFRSTLTLCGTPCVSPYPKDIIISNFCPFLFLLLFTMSHCYPTGIKPKLLTFQNYFFCHNTLLFPGSFLFPTIAI